MVWMWRREEPEGASHWTITPAASAEYSCVPSEFHVHALTRAPCFFDWSTSLPVAMSHSRSPQSLQPVAIRPSTAYL